MRGLARLALLALAAATPGSADPSTPGEHGGPPPAEAVLLPGAANTLGTHGSRWRSDLTVRNPGGAPIEIRVYFLRAGTPGDLALAPQKDFFLIAGESKDVRNVLGTELGVTGTGALMVSASRSIFPNNPAGAAVSAHLRTARPLLFGPGDVGAMVPAAEPTDASQQLATGVRHDGTGEKGVRASVGALNLSRTEGLALKVEYLDPSGEPLSRVELHLPPLSSAQTPVTVRLDPGSVRFTRIDGPGPFVSYVTTVDNATGESKFAYAAPAPGHSGSPVAPPGPAAE